MTQRQEHKLKAMNLPEKEEATVRAIVALLDKECGDDKQLKVRALSTREILHGRTWKDALAEARRVVYGA